MLFRLTIPDRRLPSMVVMVTNRCCGNLKRILFTRFRVTTVSSLIPADGVLCEQVTVFEVRLLGDGGYLKGVMVSVVLNVPI